MNVMKAITTAAPRPERAAERAIERTSRPDTDQSGTESATESERKRSVSRAEFSALLALISGAGSRVRSDLMQQLPAEGASLVDKLLDEAAGEQSSDRSTGEPLTGEGAFPGEKGLRTALQHGSHDRDAQRAAQEVSEALRYGILNTSIDNTSTGGAPTEPSSDDVIDLPTYAKNRGANGLLGISRAAQRISAQLGSQGEIEGERNALAVLSRIATKRGSSLEQLMAIGDVRGADARAALDALLAKAGTPSGTEIADNAAAYAASAAATASASALAAATAASAADPTTPIKDLDAVAPELRSRVQRVIDRMKGEYGHDVSIVETARSQQRQDQLFEQGRTRPGAVVTWTRDSAHTRGDAVDVIVDGSWENAQGFARLQRIAKEEGLRTLGMKDPGHLELASHSERALANAAPQALDKVTAAFQRQSSSAAAASSAPAGVAQVASVAGVAQVARVADANAAPAALGEGAAAYIAQANANTGANGEQNGNAFGRGARDENGHPINDGRKLGQAKHENAGDTSSFGAMQGNAQSGTQAKGAERAASMGPAAGSEQAQRVSDIQAMRADAPAGPLSRMTLNVENANGTQDRITVDLRGNVVDTSIETDASSAERMKLRTGELQESLSRHGLDADSVRISGTAKSEQSDASRAIGSERDALRANGATPTTSGENAQSQSQRDRATGRDWDKQQDARREQKEQAAREQQREQANQRGWQNLFNGTK